MKHSVLLLLCVSLVMTSCALFKSSTKEQIAADQEEVDALYESLSKGGEIKLKNLVYYLDQPLVITDMNGLNLDGNGCTFVMKNKDEDVILVEGSQNISLKNFKATHIEPTGPIGCTGSVVQVRNCSDVSIEKCQLNGSGIIGVTTYDTKNLKVIDNYIYNNSQYGVLFEGDTSIEIRNNKFEKNGEAGNAHVVKALNAFLSEVEKIPAGTNKAGVVLSGNTFK